MGGGTETRGLPPPGDGSRGIEHRARFETCFLESCNCWLRRCRVFTAVIRWFEQCGRTFSTVQSSVYNLKVLGTLACASQAWLRPFVGPGVPTYFSVLRHVTKTQLQLEELLFSAVLL